MNIKSLIKKHGELFGVMIEDNGEDYPILLRALHVPMFFDELQRSGWELHSLPFGFKKGDMSFETLPSITHIEAGIDSEKEQFLMDTTIGMYKEVDLKAKMVKQPATYLQFKESTRAVKTRDELLRFLDTNREGELDIDVPLTYMPLNSFVAVEALFSPEEYFSEENSMYRKLIEDRRSLSLKSFIRLAKSLVKMGLPETYSAKDLIDFYFSWGICGINVKPFDKKVEDRNVLLGAPIHSLREEEIPYIMEGTLTYMSTAGEVYRPATCQGPGYKPGMSELEMETKRRELNTYGYEYVAPILLKAIASNQITTYMSDNMTIQYDENQILFSIDGRVITTHTLRATSPEDPAKKLSPRFYNIIDPDKQNEMFVNSYLNAVARELINRTITYVNVSSYKAILASGGGRASAFSKILNNPDFGKDAAESLLGEDDEMSGTRMSNDELMRQLTGNIHNFLRGDIDKTHKLHDDLESMVSSIMEGHINIDSTFAGGKMDQLASMGDVVETLKIAYKYLGISLEDISKAVMDVTKDTKFFDLKGKDKSVRINLFSRDAKKNGYIADFNEYKVAAAKEAMWYHYVQEVYRELGPKGNPRPKHIAVRMLGFYRGSDDRQSYNVWKYVTDLFEHEIENHVVWRDQQKMRELLPRLVPQAIFEAALKGEINFPKPISGRKLMLDTSTLEAVRQCMTEQYDSTIAIAETAISRDGKFYRCCVNATIMDEYVIPNKGITISEKPFSPMWIDLRNISFDKKKEWIEKSYIPDYKFTGYQPFYRQFAATHIPNNMKVTSVPETVPSYVQWADEFKEEYPKNEELIAPRHYVYSVYPGLLDDEYEMEVEGGRRLPAPVAKHLWGIDPVTSISREDMFKRFPELRSYFEIIESLPPAKEGVRKFGAYSLEDFFHLSNFEAMNMAPNFGKAERPIAVRNNIIYFRDFHMDYSEIETLDSQRYAVKHLCGRKYIFEDINGKLWEVVV